ncbi:hypothetical protein D3C76_1593090 [compost metagenome]
MQILPWIEMTTNTFMKYVNPNWIQVDFFCRSGEQILIIGGAMQGYFVMELNLLGLVMKT